MGDSRSKRQALKRLLAEPRSIMVPGIHDMISARIANEIGFEAVYMTGYGVVASFLGLPDLGIATYTDMRQCVERLSEVTTAPLIADADTGYGGLLNVRQTVLGFEAAGAAGLQLEDQQYPKKCGRMSGIRVVPTAEMVKKLRIAVDSRLDDNLVIVARTDALSSFGLDEALRRAEAYAATGADALFVEGIHKRSDLEKISASVDLALVGIAPEDDDEAEVQVRDLMDCGVRIIAFPVTACLAASAAAQAAYQAIKNAHTGHMTPPPLYPFEKFGALMGVGALTALSEEYDCLSCDDETSPQDREA